MSIRVVLADDHVVLRQGVRALLELHGLEVVAEASDGRAAVELAREHEPDVAVLDIMMPLLNGIDAARQIVEARPGIQVVMLTALEQERLVTEAVRAGVRGSCSKPRRERTSPRRSSRCRAAGSTSGRASLRPWWMPAGPPPRKTGPTDLARAPGRAARGRRQVDQTGCRVCSRSPQDRGIPPRARDEEVELHDVAGLVRYAIREGLVVP